MKRMALAVLLLSFASLSIPGRSHLEAGPPPWRCGTPEPTPDEIAVFQARAEQYKNQPALTPPVANFCIPIAAHIIRKDDGTGGLSLGQIGQGLEACDHIESMAGISELLGERNVR